MKNVGLKSGFRLSGKYRFISLKPKPSWVPLHFWLMLYRYGLRNFMVKRVSPYIENLVVFNQDNGVNIILQHLAGETEFPLELNNASIGTGTTAPDDSDTDLETPVAENLIRATYTLTVDTLITEWFISDEELPDGTYTEFGLKCGTQLFTRSLIDPSHTKEENEDTLVEYTIEGYNTLA